MCGASSIQTEAYNSMKSVRDLLTNNLNTVFKTNTGILSNLTNKLTPIFNAGPTQQGFSPAQMATLQAQNVDQNAQQGRAAAIATAARVPGTTGGAPLSSGAQAQINAELAARTGESIAQGARDITLKGFDLGNQNWKAALQGLAVAPGELEAPITAAATPTISSEGQTATEANTITAANRRWEGDVGGIVGGIVAGPLGYQAGSKLGQPAGTTSAGTGGGGTPALGGLLGKFGAQAGGGGSGGGGTGLAGGEELS